MLEKLGKRTVLFDESKLVELQSAEMYKGDRGVRI